jgi:hypothetical protein
MPFRLFKPWLWFSPVVQPPVSGEIHNPNSPSRLGLAALEQARADIGKGEIGGNNRGPYVWGLTGRKTSGAWCAAAVYTWIWRASKELGIDCPIPRSNGAKKLCQLIEEHGGRRVTAPLPGDVSLWDRGGWKGHVGIVEIAIRLMNKEPDSRYQTIEGNVGRFPAKTARYKHTIGEPKHLGFYRLP